MTPIDAAAPERAARRADLTFLRRRARPVSRPNPAIAEFVSGRASAHASTSSGAPSAAAQGPTGRSASASPDRSDPAPAAASRPSTAGSLLDLSRPTPAAPPPEARPQSRPPAASAAATSLDLSAPATATSPPAGPRPAPGLDLSTPGPPGPTPPPPGSGASTSLDLGAVPIRTAPAQTPPAAPATSLDLSPTRPPSTTTPRAPDPGIARTTAAAADRTTGYQLPAGLRPPGGRPHSRTQPDVSTILGPQNPTVTLTRLQSGIGTLSVEAAVTESVGDLRLGAAYQLRSGRSSTVQHHAGRRFAPPNESHRPLLVASRQQFERLAVDLRQVSDLERLVVYAFSGNGGQLHWGGTLLVSTFAGDRIEMPIELPPTAAVAVLASVYNVRGELVVRSEMDLIGHSIQEACRGYGFDRITWLDEITPID